MADFRLRRIELKNFKAFENFSLVVQEMNVLVGPNNCGKSTILSACRALAGALKKARSRNAEPMENAGSFGFGWRIEPDLLPITMENIHHDYGDLATSARFTFSNDTALVLTFPADGGCILWADGAKSRITTPTALKQCFPIEIAHVPVLGPVDNDEIIVTQDTVRRGLGTQVWFVLSSLRANSKISEDRV